MAYKRRPGETAHQARERIARAKGFRSYREYRNASPARREQYTRALAATDPEYAKNAKGAAHTIRTRSRQQVETPAGRVLTTTSMVRLRKAARDIGAGQMAFTLTVRVNEVDRRRRDKRRRRGRDTAIRTLRFTRRGDDFDTSSVAAFAADFAGNIDGELDRLYVGAGYSWSLHTLSVVLRSVAA